MHTSTCSFRPCPCHEKKSGATWSKARSPHQGHPRPAGPQVTYQMPADMWEIINGFCLKSLSCGMVHYTALANWYTEFDIPNRWVPWGPEKRPSLQPHLPVTRIQVWEPLTQGLSILLNTDLSSRSHIFHLSKSLTLRIQTEGRSRYT